MATLTAIAGNLTTQAGLVDAFPRVFTVVAIAMVALAGFAALAVPRQSGHETTSSHHGGH